jgi:hypothetical protein
MVQFWTMAMGGVTASATGIFIKKRPSFTTSYWGLPRNPAVKMYGPLIAIRVENRATAAPGTSVREPGATWIGTAIRLMSGAM